MKQTLLCKLAATVLLGALCGGVSAQMNPPMFGSFSNPSIPPAATILGGDRQQSSWTDDQGSEEGKKDEQDTKDEKNGDEAKDKKCKPKTVWQALHLYGLCPCYPECFKEKDEKGSGSAEKEGNGSGNGKGNGSGNGSASGSNGSGSGSGSADDEEKDKEKDKEEDNLKWLPEGWNFHAQTTIIPNFQPPFGAQYSGPNSLSTAPDRRATITSDIFLGVPLWCGAELHADVLMWQGFGLSNSFGLEAFPDADAYKSGTVDPRFMLSHFFVRQTLGLGGEQEDVPDGQFTLPGKRDVERLTITVGRLNMAELFDNNTYNHDPHTQFMSWASTMLTWDYAADTIGYTTGISFELNQPCWALRYGWFQLPGSPNGFTSDDRVFMWPVEPGEQTTDGEFWKEWAMMLEFERRWKLGCECHPGAIRLQAWLDHGNLASFSAATPLLLASPPPPNTPQGVEITVPAAAFDYRFKYGLGVNWEQEIAKHVGVFGRVGWQDGHVAAATFTDADWTVQLGLSLKGNAWYRPGDTFGICGNLAGASSEQIAFLKAGGTGILNGDGNLTYACEKSIETYYDFGLGKGFHLAFDYQFFADPAFNADRGPVNVFAARLHWEY